MKTFYVFTDRGYAGTQEIMELEARSLEEAEEFAHQEIMSSITVCAFESEAEAEEEMY